MNAVILLDVKKIDFLLKLLFRIYEDNTYFFSQVDQSGNFLFDTKDRDVLGEIFTDIVCLSNKDKKITMQYCPTCDTDTFHCQEKPGDLTRCSECGVENIVSGFY